jgi:NADPH2:quinone reductase
MKAIVCKAWGLPDSLVVEELADLAAAPGAVVIDVKAAAVNFPDVLTIQGKYQFKPVLPFTPGNELAGVVRRPVGLPLRRAAPLPSRPWCRPPC